MMIEGFIKTGTRTKELVKYLSINDIAVIKHDDIDELAAESLISTGVKAIVNTGSSMSGRYISRGTSMLVNSGMQLYDTIVDFNDFKDGDFIKLKGKDLILNNNQWYANACLSIGTEYIKQKENESRINYKNELSGFIDNSIKYMEIEKNIMLNFNDYPELNAVISGRNAIVVVRSAESMESLISLRQYIEKDKPILIGVDGGADIIISCGFTPDIIIGDMDSVSDMGIFRSKEVILHSYMDGRCPCLERISPLNIKYKVLSMPGTSEDIALMLAYDKGAANIVLIGGHSCVSDFLERGRLGMGSTLITRLKVEDRLIDYKHFIRLQQMLDIKAKESFLRSEGELACGEM